MPDDQTYKQFVAQFNLSEWKRLCKHRLFLHFLKIDLKTAASIASEALDRYQQAAGAVWEAHLHRAVAEVLDVPGVGVLPAGGGDGAPVGQAKPEAKSGRQP